MASRQMDGRCGADTRCRLLAAAARIFAQHGAAGSTTRRIAAEAGVNEVTLFRLFGSKDALLDAAVHASTASDAATALPDVPVDPERELATWSAAELARLRRSAELLRQCFAESGQNAAHVREAGGAVAGSATVLRAYVEELGRWTPLVEPADREVAIAMLVSSIVADALGRDAMAGVHVTPAAEVPLRYARGFLRALGWREWGEWRGAAAPGVPGRWEWATPEP